MVFKKYSQFLKNKVEIIEQCTRVHNIRSLILPDIYRTPRCRFINFDVIEFNNNCIIFKNNETENFFGEEFIFNTEELSKTDGDLIKVYKEDQKNRIESVRVSFNLRLKQEQNDKLKQYNRLKEDLIRDGILASG